MITAHEGKPAKNIKSLATQANRDAGDLFLGFNQHCQEVEVPNAEADRDAGEDLYLFLGFIQHSQAVSKSNDENKVVAGPTAL